VDDNSPGKVSLAVEWLAEPEGVSGDKEAAECARASIEIWVVVAELQLVQRPWGAVAGSRKPLQVQPWVSLVALLPAEWDGGNQGRGVESVDDSSSASRELGSAVCGFEPLVLNGGSSGNRPGGEVEPEDLTSKRGADLQGAVAKFRNLRIPCEDFEEEEEEGSGRSPGGLYVLEFEVGLMCGLGGNGGDRRGHAALAHVRDLWRGKCIQGSMAKSVRVDVAVFGSEADSSAASGAQRLRGMAEFLLRERIASINARLAEAAHGGVGQEEGVAGRAASRRLMQEAESLPLLRRLLADIPDAGVVVPSCCSAVVGEEAGGVGLGECSECLRKEGSAGRERWEAGGSGFGESSHIHGPGARGRGTGGLEREEDGAREPKVAVCVSGAMRALQPDLLHATLLSKLKNYDMFVYTLDDGTAVRLPALAVDAADIAADYPLDMSLTDAFEYVYASPYHMEPVQRLVQLWHGVDRCFRLIQQAEARRGRRYDLVIRARPDIMINGLSAADFGWSSPAMRAVLVPATPRQARWAHITDVFACGPRDLMGAYMTIFRSCLYTARTPLYDTHPRWDSEEKLEKCLHDLGVPWNHVGRWRFVALRARSSCGSTGCWDRNALNDDSADDGPFRYFRNGSRAF